MTTGVLLVNLGTPASPNNVDVKPYLKEFLSDPNVIHVPKPIWQVILNGFILPMRTWRSATFYREIWLEEGSPLTVYTAKLAENLRNLRPDWLVGYAMTYGSPTIPDRLQQLRENGADDIIVVPLFPQYSTTTTKTIVEKATAADPNAQIILSYETHPAYIEALAEKIKVDWQSNSYDKLMLSYHGIPTSYVRQGDDYLKQVNATTEALKTALQLDDTQIVQTFQSKFGPTPWLKPYTSHVLTELPIYGDKNVLVATPGFVIDSLETLNELKITAAQTFKAAGGDRFSLVSPLNADPALAKMYESIVSDYVR